jgi:hypothetical protein
MNRTIRSAFVVAVALGALCACAPTTRFSWGTYEDALYAYYKTPAQREEYREALIAAIERGRAGDKVAPGLLAELGYLYLEDGNLPRAQELFQEEMMRFPESRPFLTRIISNSRLRSAVPQPGGTS